MGLVNSLRLDKSIINELECSILLYYSGTSRKSADQQKELAKNIINDQIARTSEKKTETMDAMKSLKESAHQMKECVLNVILRPYQQTKIDLCYGKITWQGLYDQVFKKRYGKLDNRLGV